MLLISHRGNISGRNPRRENTISYVQEAIDLGYMVECDLWVNENKLYLDHSVFSMGGYAETTLSGFKNPLIPESFLRNNVTALLIHCKNKEALSFCQGEMLHYFYHSNDSFTVSSFGFPIAHSKEKPTKDIICMLPETHGLSKDSVKECLGVCSDIISFYK